MSKIKSTGLNYHNVYKIEDNCTMEFRPDIFPHSGFYIRSQQAVHIPFSNSLTLIIIE